MAVNRGKQFEKCIQEALEALPDCSVDRIPDQMSKYKGSTNVCDYFAYRYPKAFYLECKSCHKATFPLDNISGFGATKADKYGQWQHLLEKSKITGVVAGYFIWWIDFDVTIFVTAQSLNAYYEATGLKSINVNKLSGLGLDYKEVPGIKKRVVFKYFLGNIIE